MLLEQEIIHTLVAFFIVNVTGNTLFDLGIVAQHLLHNGFIFLLLLQALLLLITIVLFFLLLLNFHKMVKRASLELRV